MTRGGFEGLDACVHCGFCLQACPTFLATGDESDSPRGRIELMRALERGDLTADDAALSYHLDRCLGCRGCEPVCPSGVQYGHGLEAAPQWSSERRLGIPAPLTVLCPFPVGMSESLLACVKRAVFKCTAGGRPVRFGEAVRSYLVWFDAPN